MESRESPNPRFEYIQRLASTEHGYIFGNAIESKRAAEEFETLKAMRQELFVPTEAEPIEEFYEASRDVEVLITAYYGLDKYLLEQTAKAGKKPTAMTDDEIAALAANYQSIGDIEIIENDAIDLLDEATAKHWDRPRINNSNEAALLKNNLEYLRATRIVDGSKRAAALDQLLAEQRMLINALEEDGKNGEWMIIYLISKWAKDNNHTNLIKIMHNDPRSDLKYKNDATIWLGFRSGTMQIETPSENRTEESLAESFGNKTGAVHSTVGVAQFPYGTLRRLYDGRGAGRADKNRIVNILGGHLQIGGAGDFLPLLYKKRKSKAEKKATRPGLIKSLPKVVDVVMLMTLGLVAENDRANMEKILSAKKRAVDVITAEIKKKKINADEDLKDPETIARLKKLFE